ncbi:hypothetical protein K474DRAFT_1654739 [Panus rudis PR-1116 ss-1]|nr:hypothetical protein K474DRAFT_1654739 [Panus rudis PR-1116 ss-1]
MIQTAHIHRELEGVPSDVVVQKFADSTFLLLTQLGKVGNLMQATMPSTAPLLPPPPVDPANPNVIPLPPPSPAVELSPLLGNAPSEHLRTLQSLYVSQAATLVWAEEAVGALEMDRKPVVVGVALQRTSGPEEEALTGKERDTFHGFMEMVREVLAKK